MSIKCLFNLALRQSLGLVENLLRLASLDWSVSDNSAVCRRQKTLLVQLPYRASTTALEIRAIEVTDNSVEDGKPCALLQAPG